MLRGACKLCGNIQDGGSVVCQACDRPEVVVETIEIPEKKPKKKN
jgi:uncharacterized Zn finger protein (UPF0148 family)